MQPYDNLPPRTTATAPCCPSRGGLSGRSPWLFACFPRDCPLKIKFVRGGSAEIRGSWTVYVAVYGMTSCGYKKKSGVFILLNCPHVSTFCLWLHLVLETSWFLYWLTAVWTSLSVGHSFMWSDVTFWVFLFHCFCRFGVSYWLGCYLHLHSYQIC